MKRSRAGPPGRLSWGGGDNLSSKVEMRQRSMESNAMWTDRYAPTKLEDLCIAPKKVKQVKEWLEDGAPGMLILVGSPGIGKSTLVKILCRKVHEWVEEPSCASPIQSFASFLQQSMYLDHDTTVMIDDLPYLHDEEMYQRFRQALGDHILQCPRKTIWVFSDTMGGSHRPKELESLLDPKILYHSGQVQIMQIHPVTTAKMKKLLQKVCSANQVRLPDVTMYNGDLRHALLSLQFSSSTDGLRDSRLSPFHALGKLLYAKRVASSKSENAHLRPPLEFKAEEVVEQSGMPLFSSLYFLQGHAPDFFTEVNDLALAFDKYSDASLFLNTPLEHYSISLTGRAAATSNWNPSPNKFRTFSSPLIFEVNRKARDNRIELELLHSASAEASQVNFSNFVTEDYPYLRRIHPHAISGRNLYSHIEKTSSQSAGDSRADVLAEEQAAILALDDIEDFSDDDGIRPDPIVPSVTQEPEIIVID